MFWPAKLFSWDLMSRIAHILSQNLIVITCVVSAGHVIIAIHATLPSLARVLLASYEAPGSPALTKSRSLKLSWPPRCHLLQVIVMVVFRQLPPGLPRAPGKQWLGHRRLAGRLTPLLRPHKAAQIFPILALKQTCIGYIRVQFIQILHLQNSSIFKECGCASIVFFFAWQIIRSAFL